MMEQDLTTKKEAAAAVDERSEGAEQSVAGMRLDMNACGKNALRRYLAYAKPYKWIIVVVVVAGVAKFTLPLVFAHLTGEVVDGVIGASGPMSDRYRLLWWLAGAMVALGVLEWFAIYVRGTMTQITSSSMAFDLRQDLWRHLQRLSLGFHQSRPTGSMVSRLMSDISVSQQMVNGGIVNVLIDTFSGGIAMLMLATISWKLTLLLLFVLPFYGIAYRRLNPRIRRISRQVQDQTANMSGIAIERLSGIAVVQSFAQEEEEEKVFAHESDELRGLNVLRGKLNHTLQAFSSTLITFSRASIWIGGAYLILNEGSLTVGNLVKYTIALQQLFMPVRRFSQINIVFQRSMAAIERIFGLFDVVPEVRERPGASDEPVREGYIEFDHASFRYTPDRPDVVREMTFSAKPGEKVAIVGESGAGKSTVVTLIPRLYDVTAGAVRIDGRDVRDYRLTPLRRSIGIVLQDSILFTGTIRENLRYGRKDASEAEIIEAAKLANAHEFILDMPQGYDTEVGERGMTVSGGQRQRLSLARTILQDPRILILDEATSSLDSESENLINEALERLMKNRTSLIIAHRLSTVVNADRILVFRDGQVIESGRHEQLLERDGHYRYLFEQQFGPLHDLVAQARNGRNGQA
jgi:subfamily B ATP-binding cassette protein MsbA